MSCAIDDIKEYLRKIRKYSEKYPTFDEIDNKIIGIINDAGINFD